MSIDPKSPFSGKVTAKLLDTSYRVAADNIIAGDWIYFVNTDMLTHEVYDGDQGSNAIAIGQGLIGRYYDNEPPRTLKEYVCKVHNWRYIDREEAIRRYKTAVREDRQKRQPDPFPHIR